MRGRGGKTVTNRYRSKIGILVLKKGFNLVKY
jgi:hypothetical protein